MQNYEQPKEYLVQTECGRNFVWSALDLDNCERSVIYAGYKATHIEEYHDATREAQEVLIDELNKSIEGGEAA